MYKLHFLPHMADELPIIEIAVPVLVRGNNRRLLLHVAVNYEEK
jgi:hypothetical protein